MAIFELLNYIVNEPPPELPNNGEFSQEFCNFITRCLQKDPNARADLTSLMSHPWVKAWDLENLDIAGWVQKTMESPPPSSES